MKSPFRVIAVAMGTAGILGVVAACTGTDGASDNPASDGDGGASDSSAPATETDGNGTESDAVGEGEGGDRAVPQAYVRVAQWSPDAPALDFCITKKGDSFAGATPELARIFATGDSGTPAGGDEGAERDASDAGNASDAAGAMRSNGLVFPEVTSYLAAPSGEDSMRLVAAGSTDCGTSLGDLASVVLAASTFTTVAALGETTPIGSDHPLELVSLPDDVAAPTFQIALRFVNASPNPTLTPVDFGTGSIAGNGGAFATLFAGVPFGQAGSSTETDAGAVDMNGYLAETPLAGATLSAHANAATDTTTALNDVSINGGFSATVALVDGVSDGGAARRPELLLCYDVDDSSGTSTGTYLGQCSIVSTP